MKILVGQNDFQESVIILGDGLGMELSPDRLSINWLKTSKVNPLLHYTS